MEEIFVQIKFTLQTKYGALTDSLFLPFEQYDKIEASVIEEMKQERANNHVHNLENPPQQIELTKDQIEEHLRELESEQRKIEDQKLGLQEKLADLEKIRTRKDKNG